MLQQLQLPKSLLQPDQGLEIQWDVTNLLVIIFSLLWKLEEPQGSVVWRSPRSKWIRQVLKSCGAIKQIKFKLEVLEKNHFFFTSICQSSLDDAYSVPYLGDATWAMNTSGSCQPKPHGEENGQPLETLEAFSKYFGRPLKTFNCYRKTYITTFMPQKK